MSDWRDWLPRTGKWRLTGTDVPVNVIDGDDGSERDCPDLRDRDGHDWKLVPLHRTSTGNFFVGVDRASTGLIVWRHDNVLILRMGTVTRQLHMKTNAGAAREFDRLRRSESAREAAFASWGAGDE